jgi:hypothetical protein
MLDQSVVLQKVASNPASKKLLPSLQAGVIPQVRFQDSTDYPIASHLQTIRH